jgi:hypothetical protein
MTYISALKNVREWRMYLCRISCNAIDLYKNDTNAVHLCWIACNAIDLCNFVNLCRSTPHATYLCISKRNAAGLRSLEHLCIFTYTRYKAVGVEKRIQTGRSKNIGSIPGRQDTFLFPQTCRLTLGPTTPLFYG